MNKKTLVIIIAISIILIIGIFLTIGHVSNKETSKNSGGIQELSNTEKEKYSSEIQLILDFSDKFGYINISEKSAEQLVAFSHQNELGAITDIDCSGIVDYYENDKLISTWTILLYAENGAFCSDVSQEDGVIYSITYNNEICYTKGNLSSNNDLDDSKSEGVDWSGLNITIDGIEYSFPWSINDFINNGWEASSSYDEELLEEEISYGSNVAIELGHRDYSADLNIYAENNNLDDIKGYEATIRDLYIGQWSGRSNPLFQFYGIEAGDSKETVENIFGTPDNIYTDEGRGYIDYTYNSTLKDGTTVKLVLTVNIKDNELYEIDILQYPSED